MSPSLRAALTEEAGDDCDVGAVNEPVDRVGRDVIAGGAGGTVLPK